MPFTPFHWGPSSWVGLLLWNFFDFPTLLLASVMVDIEPFLIFFFNLPHSLHGFFHSFLGGSILAVLIVIILCVLRDTTNKVMAILKLAQDPSFKKIPWTSFFGVYFHILPNSFLYRDIRPFYPLESNPFLGLFSSKKIYLFCDLSFLVGMLLFLVRLGVIKRYKL